MLSADIDLMGSVLGIIRQAHGIDYLYAHSVRVEQMSLLTLGNSNYTLYGDVLDLIRQETPNRLVKSSDRFYVPIYRIYVAGYGESFSWSIAAVGDQGDVFPEAVQSRRARAVERRSGGCGSTLRAFLTQACRSGICCRRRFSSSTSLRCRGIPKP